MIPYSWWKWIIPSIEHVSKELGCSSACSRVMKHYQSWDQSLQTSAAATRVTLLGNKASRLCLDYWKLTRAAEVNKHRVSAPWLDIALNDKKEKAFFVNSQWVFLCLPSAMWPFPLAKPLGFGGTTNKGCISFIPTTSQALTLFIDSLWGLLPSQGEHMGPCLRLMPWGAVTFWDKVVTPWPLKRNRSIQIVLPAQLCCLLPWKQVTLGGIQWKRDPKHLLHLEV